MTGASGTLKGLMGTNIEVGDGLAVATMGDAIIVMWREPSRVERLRWLGQRLRNHAMRNEGGIIIAMVVLSTSSPPDGPARAESTRLLADIKTRIRRAITYPVGDAMWSSVVRTIIRGMFLINGQSAIQTVASSVAETIRLVRDAASDATPRESELRAVLPELATALGVAWNGRDKQA